MAAALKMQILCGILIGLISHGSSLNVNRPSGRWARSDDGTDGWRASNGPYNLDHVYPVSYVQTPAAVAAPAAVSAPSSVTAAARKDDGPHIPVVSPEGFYELVVGKKSPLSSESMGEGNAPTGSPDVIIGRVMTASAGIESSAPTSTASVIGRTQPQQPIIPVASSSSSDDVLGENNNGNRDEEKAHHQADERIDIDEILKMESRASADSLIKKNDYPLPPGSFYLPAVSRKADQYFSDSEHAIYIPLQRPDQSTPAFPVRTRVVLVNKQQQQPPPPPPPPSVPPAVYHSKEGDEEEEEEEEDAEEEDEDNEEDQNLDLVPGASRRPAAEQPPIPIKPQQQHGSGPLDLVMTLYPNLPKLVSPSHHFSTQGIKNFLLNKLPGVNLATPAAAAGSVSVIHEAKVVTPPQGYLPQLISKPVFKPSVSSSSSSIKPTSNFVTQIKTPSKNHFVTASDQRHHQQQPIGSLSGIQFTPFTPDDISPLNFLLPPASAEKVTATDQPDTRSNSINSAVLPPPNNGDLIADSNNVQITAPPNPLQVVPAPKLDFSWKLFQPLASELAHQQTVADATALFGLHAANNKQQEHQQQKKTVYQQEQKQIAKPTEGGGAAHQFLLGPGDTGEIVVRTKMATSGNDGGNHVNRPDTSPESDIITGYYDDIPTDKSVLVKYDLQPFFHGQQPVLPISSSTPKPLENNKETLTTTTLPPIIYTAPAAEEIVATTTVASSRDETIKPDSKLLSNLQLDGKFPHRNVPQDHSHQAELASDNNVPLQSQAVIRVVKDEDDDVFSAPRLPDIADDQQVAGSQIHETSVYEENLPRIRPIKPSGAEGEGKSSTPYYKAGKTSPKGAMYTVTQGHSKVKFFGFNALHNGELKQIDGKYVSQHQPEYQESDWKFSPYLPGVRLHGNPAFKIPKKSIPISPGKKSTIRPVYFAKRPDGQTDNSPSSNRRSSTISISEPFEYRVHLQKMAEDRGRLPSQQAHV